jgi:hypothetical protein
MRLLWIHGSYEMENKNSVSIHLDGAHENHMNKTSEIDI